MSSFSVKDQRITISDDSGVLNTIKRCFGINLGITLRDQSIWIGDLCSVWHTIKNMAAREHISVPSDLESFVDAEVARRTEMARSNVSESESVSFDELMFLFEPNDRIVVTVDGHQMGAIFNSAVPVLINSMRFTSVEFIGITNLTKSVSKQKMRVQIASFAGTVPISRCSVRPASKADVAKLSERGSAYRRFSSDGPKYLSYSGNVTRQEYRANYKLNASGRVMLDPVGFSSVDADGWDVCGNKSPVVDAEHRDEMSYEIPDDELWMTYPFLYGFSFKNKIWGRFEVSGLSEIRWRKDAFDLLVMDAGEKELIRALVEHRGASFGDVIDGKSGGTIFLLHGSPGLGKTLTAETVAEVLKKPLYSVGVGELGTSPGDLEMNLREILEIATSWDAVLLLDEADIFLEARRDSDILRNAMVGIFLRLLEYYHGVLFLTSNRAKNIDEAFVSRISIIINYGANNISTRSQIWKNILGAAGVSIHDRDIEALSRFDINGRQIKNVVRSSQTLARARGIDTDAKLISSVISKTIDSIASLKDT